ncbi:MAG: hypothetical protein IBX55_22975 [Methyloprofundus sp.]|nr:hypothetical protein [Methyloprofundus sp.]
MLVWFLSFLVTFDMRCILTSLFRWPISLYHYKESITKLVKAKDLSDLEKILENEFDFSYEEVEEVLTSCDFLDKSCIVSKVIEIILRKQLKLAEIVNSANLKQRLNESEEAYREALKEMLKQFNQDVISAIIDYLDAVRQENDSRFSMR